MRPSTSRARTGPFNLYNAVVTAADKQSANRVLVVMNDTVMDGRDVTKTNTTDVAMLKAVNYGPLGYIHTTVKLTTSVRQSANMFTSTPRRVEADRVAKKSVSFITMRMRPICRAKALADAG